MTSFVDVPADLPIDDEVRDRVEALLAEARDAGRADAAAIYPVVRHEGFYEGAHAAKNTISRFLRDRGLGRRRWLRRVVGIDVERALEELLDE